MARAVFRFHPPLELFLAKELRGSSFERECARAATLKNAIEALGVPHTEVGTAAVNGAPATLQRAVREGDEIELFAAEAQEGDLFLADAHLGGLARFLRMLGFDTAHENAMSDAEIRRLAREEQRIVLTRDRELLKCADIARGAYVRTLKAEEQLREVAARFNLAPRARPFSLCLHCNRPLATVAKSEVAGRIPPTVAALHERFTHCLSCKRVYWPGSHYDKMLAALGRALR